MSLRFSPKEAAQRGFITDAEAKQMLSRMAARGRGTRLTEAPGSPVSAVAPGNVQSRTPARYDAEADTPQRKLYDALREALGDRVEWEKKGLVPGRRFCIDIFIEPNLVVEMDGFAYHSSLEAFQKDRERKNLLEALGYRVFHAYAGQVLDADARQRLVTLIVMAAHGEKPTREMCVAGLRVSKET